ncbi:MAG TPA: adenosylmethionine--8-amino-7-oxononanoate transaminase [Verrucomicrobiae bacterium]
MQKIAQLDHEYVWHPFTQMKDWLREEPIVITRGKGVTIWDSRGRKYLDANSSIWTNLHGHAHPKMNRAINAQLKKIAHSSALGLANEPAALLAERLIKSNKVGENGPTKVFFSDDGSTAMEVALKLSYEYWRRTGVSKPRFLSMEGAYHGDTVGAVSLGHVDLFHRAFKNLLFETDSAPAPYCYRCPHNKAEPQRADARSYRKCDFECVTAVEKKFSEANRSGKRITGFVVEPLMQGAAGMIAQPEGWLTRVCQIARNYRAHVIADEVMTGFGRVTDPAKGLFAMQQEDLAADFVAVAKGLTGGYLPMAATLTTRPVFEAFLGEYEEFKTFFHGHSYTGNQLGASAALASLGLLQSRQSLAERTKLATRFDRGLQRLWKHPNVGDMRRVGLVAGIELVRNWRTREAFELRERVGIRVCNAMTKRGVLTRPIGNVIVLMPPYCTPAHELAKMIGALEESLFEVLPAESLS